MSDSTIQVLEGILGTSIMDDGTGIEVSVNGLAATESPRADPGILPGEVFTPKMMLGIAIGAFLAWKFIGGNPRAASLGDIRYHFYRRRGRGEFKSQGIATRKTKKIDKDVYLYGQGGKFKTVTAVRGSTSKRKTKTRRRKSR